MDGLIRRTCSGGYMFYNSYVKFVCKRIMLVFDIWSCHQWIVIDRLELSFCKNVEISIE